MVTVRFYFDRRTANDDGTFPVKLAVCHRRRTAYANLGVFVREEQWDSVSSSVVGRRDRVVLNERLWGARGEMQRLCQRLMREGRLERLSATDIRDIFMNGGDCTGVASESFGNFYLSVAACKSAGTKRLYMVTYRRMLQYYPNLDGLRFEDIDRRWLEGFDSWLLPMCPSRNSRNIHMRNIRAVFNAAIDDGITSAYPFRRFKLRPQPTRKRALSVEDMRVLFSYDVEPWQEYYRDMFKLSFMLIGINTADMFGLRRIERSGRVEYSRAKTHRLYSVKVEPEAREIIEKYRGQHSLLSLRDRWAHSTTFTSKVNAALKEIGQVSYSGRGGKKRVEPLFPDLTMYWARHSWATIAASLDIPKETIAHALGHGCNTVTDIYIDFDERKVDEANRRVLDWVLYGRR